MVDWLNKFQQKNSLTFILFYISLQATKGYFANHTHRQWNRNIKIQKMIMEKDHENSSLNPKAPGPLTLNSVRKYFNDDPTSGFDRAKSWRKPFQQSQKKPIEEKFTQIHDNLTLNYFQNGDLSGKQITQLRKRISRNNQPKRNRGESDQRNRRVRNSQQPKHEEVRMAFIDNDGNQNKEINNFQRMAANLEENQRKRFSTETNKEQCFRKVVQEARKKIMRGPKLRELSKMERSPQIAVSRSNAHKETKFHRIKVQTSKKDKSIQMLKSSIDELENIAKQVYGLRFSTNPYKCLASQESETQSLPKINYSQFKQKLEQIKPEVSFDDRSVDCSIPGMFLKVLQGPLRRKWVPSCNLKDSCRYLRV